MPMSHGRGSRPCICGVNECTAQITVSLRWAARSASALWYGRYRRVSRCSFSTASIWRFAGMIAPSEIRITSVGSCSPRLGSITSREKLDRTALAFRCAARPRVTPAAPMSYAMWRAIWAGGNPRSPPLIQSGTTLVAWSQVISHRDGFLGTIRSKAGVVIRLSRSAATVQL